MRAAYKLGRIRWWIGNVHRGNGAHHASYDGPNTFVISLHQHRLFAVGRALAGTSSVRAVAECSTNEPLQPGCGAGAYRVVLNESLCRR
jgi:acetoin utilization deacetylase AcuC-like enzyme